MWIWDQSAGALRDAKGVTCGYGYAGMGAGKNNPDAQGLQGVGPVPQGRWKICEPRHSENTGPYTMNLEPEEGTDTLGRSAFRIHGDSIAHPGTASHGCIILSRVTRQLIWESGDHELLVIA